MITTSLARAYCNNGRWVADCPRPMCGNAMKIKPKQVTFSCQGEDGCRLIVEIEWPADIDEIDAALSERPVPRTRNWAPVGHWQAEATGFPKGQTAQDLLEETRAHLQGPRVNEPMPSASVPSGSSTCRRDHHDPYGSLSLAVRTALFGGLGG